MNFELGKEYIVKVSEEGIIPIEEFDLDRFFDKDHDDLDFLTDEEKIIIINNVLNDISEEIKKMSDQFHDLNWSKVLVPIGQVIKIINKYKEGEIE